jgi:peptidoglycan hydrolase CwlO-like protein
MSTDETKPRRFVFSFVREPQGFNVIWEMAKCEFPNPIEDFKELEVIEISALEKAQERIAELEANLAASKEDVELLEIKIQEAYEKLASQAKEIERLKEFEWM